jgi:hypothetical protein
MVTKRSYKGMQPARADQATEVLAAAFAHKQ